MKNYTYTNNFNEATHWMPTEDDKVSWDWTHVTIGKLYKLNMIIRKMNIILWMTKDINHLYSFVIMET